MPLEDKLLGQVEKELKLQIREYDDNHEALVHQTQHWAGGDEGSNNIISTPIIGITALG